jgi:glycosyltransferase involved in cell wall biosynthesis/GT2 family glycosyltransferase
MNEINFFDFSIEPGKNLNNRKIINSGRPIISIITAYYNAHRYIEQTANSIFNQTFPFWEWIIVNDGSTEGESIKALEKISKLDNRIKIFTKENEGLAKTRDYAISKATSELVYILDADDLIDNTALECSYFSMLTHPNATWVYTNTVGFGDQQYLWNVPFNTLKEKKKNLLCCNALIRKENIIKVGGYSKAENGVYEDWHLWLRLLANGERPIRMGYYGFWYRRHDNGVLSSINSKKKTNKYAMSVINKLGVNIKKSIKSIQYPRTTSYKNFASHPYEFNWDRKPINESKNGKRLLFLIPWMTIGGADKFNYNIIEGLIKKGYEITIITTESCKYFWRQKFEKYACEIFDLTTFLDRQDWPAFISYILKSRQIDLIFQTNSLYGYYLIPWIKNKFPELPIVDYIHMEEWHWRDGGYPRDSIAIEKFLDKTFTCTKYLKDLMYDKMNRQVKNIEEVYIGTDEKYFHPEKVNKLEEEWYNKHKGKKIILFPCRITEQKRPFLMLLILKKILENRKDVVIAVLGDGNLLDDVKEKSIELSLQNNIEFLGPKNDIRQYYKISDVTLICSMVEGLTLTSYESLSMGVPVVSSDVGGQKELISDDCGKIVKIYQDPTKDILNYEYSEEEINEYVKAILDIIDNPSIRKNCRNKILNGFTIEQTVHKISNKIEEIITRGSIIDKNILNNINFAERYLVLFNETKRERYLDYDNVYKKSIKDVLWRYKAWRKFIKTMQKTKIYSILKGKKTK